MFNGMARPPIVMDSCNSMHNSNMSNYMMGKYLDLVHSSSSNSDASYITQPDSMPSVLRPSVTDSKFYFEICKVPDSFSSQISSNVHNSQ